MEIARAILHHPRLWPAMARQVVKMAPNGWWRRYPYLPVPSESLWNFRLETAYGDLSAVVPEHDLAEVSAWSDSLIGNRDPRRVLPLRSRPHREPIASNEPR